MLDKIRRMCENSSSIMHDDIMYTINYCDDDYVSVTDNDDGDDITIYYEELDLNSDSFYVLVKLDPEDID